MNKQVSAELQARWVGMCNNWGVLVPINERLLCSCLAVIKSPPDWEVGVYAAGALALLGIAAVSLWKLWTSGSFPSPSPFPNYDYRYLQQKYGENYAEARQKVRLLFSWVHSGLYTPHPNRPLSGLAPTPSPLTPSWLISSCEQGPLSSSTSPA